MAAFALGLIGHALGGRAAAGRRLRDPSLLVQGRAAEALGLIGDAGSAQAIASMAGPHRPAVRPAASLEADEGASAARSRRRGVPPRRLRADASEGGRRARCRSCSIRRGSRASRWWPVAYAPVADRGRARRARARRPRCGAAAAWRGRSPRAGSARARRQGASARCVPLAQGWRTDPRVAVAAIRALAQIGSGGGGRAAEGRGPGARCRPESAARGAWRRSAR
ncbi:MAG: hypothetical protein M0C28_13155 [Candidatus Moduliflexus flocculans]|nr:hypothetical protein [Candidatus Moduliflexus flocculans]